MNLTQKILKKHLVKGEMSPGNEIQIRVDQTLTQDATGTLAYLQFESLKIKRVKTELSVSYVDHNTLQTGFENADDHRYLQSVAAKYGIIFSPAGNGVCHQLHIENFAKPGKTLIGSDSHTPTAGGIGMLAFGAGGLDVACAMAGVPFAIKMPKIVGVYLKGSLKHYSSAKDVILVLLQTLGVKGGVGKIFEYFGPGVMTLSVPERATITNMGAELGATTSIFPSDEVTRKFLKETGREKYFLELSADDGADYDEKIEIDLSDIEPMIALPHSPDNVKRVRDIEGLKVDQVCIGSCTNSSLADMVLVAEILKNKKVHPGTSLVISPGSRSVLMTLAKHGYLTEMIKSGSRIIECACGPCIGMGQSPPSSGASVRTFNRNFEGRSGTKDAKVYLSSPITAALAALHGEIVDPKKYLKYTSRYKIPKLITDKKMFLMPSKKPSKIEVLRGPNIKPLPVFDKFPQSLKGVVLLKLPDNISTDHILPAGSKILPLRSNIPAISEFTFSAVDKEFVKRTRMNNGGFVVAGENYGQGSSREHAALVLKYLGVNVVIAKSFARIHLANLVNFGVLPAIFADSGDYQNINQGQKIIIDKIDFTSDVIWAKIDETSQSIKLELKLSLRDKEIIKAGGLLNFIRFYR